MIEINGTGYISSKITKQENNDKTSCLFQIATYSYTNKETNKKIYNKFLCAIDNNFAKIFYENYIPGQKIFFRGELEQRQVKDKNDKGNEKIKFTTYNILKLTHIEFMAKSKDDNFNEKNIQNNINNTFINEFEDIEEETFS